MNPSTLRAASKLNLIRILSSHPEGMSLEDLQKISGHKSIADLKNELGELYMIEMYPYSPLDCVEIDFDGEKVKITLPVAVDKVLPLTPEEWILLREIVSKQKTDKNFDSKISEEILKKIDSIIPSGNWEPNKKIRSEIESAIQSKNQIKIQYWKRDTDLKEERSLQPWILWDGTDGYLLAFDLVKKAFRSFRLDCILEVLITQNKHSELPSDASNWLDGFTQLIDLKNKSDEKFAKVYLTDSSSFHLGGKLPLLDLKDKTTINGEDYFLYEVPIREENWFINTILGYGKSAIIVSPFDLKTKVVQHLNQAISSFT